MSLYRGVVYDHYLYFLVPAAYIVFGTWVEKGFSIRRIKPIVFTILATFLVFVFYQSVLLVSRTPARNDILKVEKVIDIVKKNWEVTHLVLGWFPRRRFRIFTTVRIFLYRE